jgi:hypothetical protein
VAGNGHPYRDGPQRTHGRYSSDGLWNSLISSLFQLMGLHLSSAGTLDYSSSDIRDFYQEDSRVDACYKKR